jgi:hypothetical protein
LTTACEHQVRLELLGNRALLSLMQAHGWLNRLAVILFCWSAFLFSACEQSVTRRVLATVLSVDGTAEVRQKDQSGFSEITPASLLEIGAVVRTGAGATLNLAFLPNTLASLAENTEVQISDLALTKDGNAMRNDVRSRTVRLLLLAGTMRVFLSQVPDCKSNLTIQTPHGELIADSDCILLVNIDNRRTRLTCVDGVAIMRTGQASFSVEAGYFQEFPSSDLSPQAAVDDAQAQREVTSMIETGQELQNLARRQRLLKPAFLDH